MRMVRVCVAMMLVVVALALALTVGGCSQPDQPVTVTPFVAKAPQPPPATQPAPAAGLEPGTRMYERAMSGK